MGISQNRWHPWYLASAYSSRSRAFLPLTGRYSTNFPTHSRMTSRPLTMSSSISIWAHSYDNDHHYDGLTLNWIGQPTAVRHRLSVTLVDPSIFATPVSATILATATTRLADYLRPTLGHAWMGNFGVIWMRYVRRKYELSR